MTNDPTLQRNQPALTTSTGAIWLVGGGMIAIAAVSLVGVLVVAGSV